jgi:hypothetical protein
MPNDPPIPGHSETINNPNSKQITEEKEPQQKEEKISFQTK